MKELDFANAGVEKAIKEPYSPICKVYSSHPAYAPLAVAGRAAALGLSGKVKSWSVGRGHARMGCCKATGEISLSYVLVFLPRELRRCTITHELAPPDAFRPFTGLSRPVEEVSGA